MLCAIMLLMEILEVIHLKLNFVPQRKKYMQKDIFITVNITGGNMNCLIPGGTLTSALQILADQFYRQPEEPTGSNLSEGDLWYDTDDDQLKVYRETSSNVFQFVPLAAATDTMDNLDGGQF